jgi:hypothetical protein
MAMRKRLSLLALAIFIWEGCANMAEQRNNPAPPALSPLEIAHDSEYVLGFPAFIAITLRCDDPRTTLMRLPAFDMFGTNGVIGLTLLPAGGKVPAVAIEPAAAMDPDLGASLFRLDPGETRRILIDLSPLLPDTLPPGAYTFALSYGYNRKVARSPFLPLRLRRPGPDEESVLARWGAEKRRAGSWGEWMATPPADPSAVAAASPGNEAFRFAACVRYAKFSRADAAGAARSLASVRGLPLPEAHALAAEVLLVAGDGTGFDSAASAVGRAHPELAWMLDAARQGKGFLNARP